MFAGMKDNGGYARVRRWGEITRCFSSTLFYHTPDLQWPENGATVSFAVTTVVVPERIFDKKTGFLREGGGVCSGFGEGGV